ncbi:GTP-binding protein gtr2 [Zancudomyces culisetae]|uniref:GTP-binding protein gtr2 n=1 Tax=Zancudomyces culisetae TaxID=1213189 RepID=A0A1R1PI64_ZANCU|nr:GTP-binding protein gtr2 [Zancudomyces culisetae]|eukprot:OMH80671.1 GTP-binding protein gtr2 [Zancudomyces culisetae]
MRSWSESYSGGNNGIGGGGGGGNGPRVITAGDATRTMQTELLMDPEEFDIYHLTFYGNENNNISSTNSRYQQHNISTPVRPYPQKSQPQPPATNNTTATASTSGGNVNCIELTFGIKEFKAILSYSEAAELPLQAHFDAGGDPILFYVSSDIFDQSNFNVSRRKPSANSVVAPNDNSHFRSNNNNMNFNGNGNVIINSSADLSFDGISAEFVLATVSDQFSSTASQATTASHSISLSASLMSTSNNNNDIKSNSQLFQSPSSKSKSNLNPNPNPKLNSKPSRYDNLPPSSFSLINNNRTNDPIANSDKNPQPSSQNPIQSPAKGALGSDHSKQSKSDLHTPLFQENHQYQQHHHSETTMDADHNDFSQQPSNNPPSSGVILTGTESMTSSAVLSLQQKDNIPHVNPGGLPSQPAYDHKNRELEYQDSLMRTPRPPNSAVDSGLAPINISNSSLLKNVQKLNVNSVSSSAKNKPKNSWKWPGLEDPIGENDQPFNSQSVPNPPDNNNVNEPYFSTSSRIQQPDLRVVDINSESNSDSDSDLESGSNSVANTISGIRPPHRSKDNNNNDNKSRDSDSDSDSDSVVLSATPPSSKRVYCADVNTKLLFGDCTPIDISTDIQQKVIFNMDYRGWDSSNVQFYVTSIYNKSIYEAMSRVSHKLFPHVNILESLLNSLCFKSNLDNAYIFDMNHKLYIASDSSPSTTQSHRFCCDTIGLIEDLTKMYRRLMLVCMMRGDIDNKMSLLELNASKISSAVCKVLE